MDRSSEYMSHFRYVGVLMKNCPKRTTELLKKICTNYSQLDKNM